MIRDKQFLMNFPVSKYDLVIEAKTTDETLDWNLETIDLTINLADEFFQTSIQLK